MPVSNTNALDHVILVLFENRSFDTFSAASTTPMRFRRSRA